jgi:hypothetical protein
MFGSRIDIPASVGFNSELDIDPGGFGKSDNLLDFRTTEILCAHFRIGFFRFTFVLAPKLP